MNFPIVTLWKSGAADSSVVSTQPAELATHHSQLHAMSAPEGHTVVASNPEDRVSNNTSIQPAVPDFSRDKEPEPIVTRRELWSYYCVCLPMSILVHLKAQATFQCTSVVTMARVLRRVGLPWPRFLSSKGF